MHHSLRFTCARLPISSSRSELIEATRQQLAGIRIDAASIGTIFEVSLRDGTARLALSSVSHEGHVNSSTEITIDPMDGVSVGSQLVMHESACPSVPVAISEGLRQYISFTKVESPDDVQRWQGANAQLRRLHGVPSDEVVGDLTARLRGKSWLQQWSTKHYGRPLASLQTLHESTSLLLLRGDPGTGKSVLMRQVAIVSARTLDEPVLYIQLNERLRGQGIQGRAGSELIGVLDTIGQVANQFSLPTVIFMDEADAVASSRGSDDVGSGAQENVAIVDGLIVALDRIFSQATARMVFVMATNLIDRIDPAIIRRATVYEFVRPGDAERKAILQDSLGDFVDPTDLERIHKALDRTEVQLTAADILNQVVAKGLREAALRDATVEPERLLQLAATAAASTPVRHRPVL